VIHDLVEGHSFLRLSLNHTQNEVLGEYGKIIGKGNINFEYILLNNLFDFMLGATDNKGRLSSQELIGQYTQAPDIQFLVMP
jgi:hypothetical protein